MVYGSGLRCLTSKTAFVITASIPNSTQLLFTSRFRWTTPFSDSLFETVNRLAILPSMSDRIQKMNFIISAK